MSDPVDEATVVPAPPRGGSIRVARGRTAARHARSAGVVLRKVEPWSVLKISFLFYLCVMVVIIGAMMILYAILGAIGALDSLTR